MRPFIYLFSFSLLSLIFLSCQKNYSFAEKTTTERLYGIWSFDKAKIRNIAAPNDNVIEDFRLSSIKFNSDYSLTYYDAQKDLLSTGEWKIYSHGDVQDDDANFILDLYIFILDTTNNVYNTRIWKNFDVDRDRLRTTEDIIGGGEYKFELKRIEKK